MNDWPWLILIPVVLCLLGFLLWHFYGIGGAIQSERARELFRLQHERIEKIFLEKAAATGLPRGLRWMRCTFSEQTVFAQECQTGSIVALTPVTIEFEAIEGSDMEGLPAVPLPRQGSAVLTFTRGEWTTAGRVIFNLSPEQVLQQFAKQYRPLPINGR